MNINATLVAQAFNFFITFWIIRFLLVKPVMAILSADQHTINNLEYTIEHTQKNISEITTQRDLLWSEAKTVLKHEQPPERTALDTVFRDITPQASPIAFSHDEKRSFIDQSAQKIVTRLEHSS